MRAAAAHSTILSARNILQDFGQSTAYYPGEYTTLGQVRYGGFPTSHWGVAKGIVMVVPATQLYHRVHSLLRRDLALTPIDFGCVPTQLCGI